jgi:hypothetical protein
MDAFAQVEIHGKDIRYGDLKRWAVQWWLNTLPVALSLETDHATEAASWEVAYDANGSGLLEIIKKLLAGGDRRRHVAIEAKGNIRLGDLERVTHGIAQDNRPLTARADK